MTLCRSSSATRQCSRDSHTLTLALCAATLRHAAAAEELLPLQPDRCLRNAGAVPCPDCSRAQVSTAQAVHGGICVFSGKHCSPISSVTRACQTLRAQGSSQRLVEPCLDHWRACWFTACKLMPTSQMLCSEQWQGGQHLPGTGASHGRFPHSPGLSRDCAVGTRARWTWARRRTQPSGTCPWPGSW